ncbi:hypothetical protein LPJGGPFB_05133 [Ensifer adhaerens]|uniref:hypothetical protein n=1 Tax=Ensifer adhaerens TaxID=106592 RepID=UPI001569DFED|nr:hypothetical protein [Ensifer adhaerens]NRP21874.1 hypothetical protein [Ensifer adhaerens]
MKEVTTQGPTPEDVAMLRRVHDRACLSANIQRRGARGEYVARFIADEFAMGNRDETSLSECALWLVRPRTHTASDKSYRIDISIYALY